MAKKSALENNARRARLAKQFGPRRARLKAIANDQSLPVEEQFAARLKLSELPRNSAKERYRKRCEVSGRPRGFYGKMKMSRIALRELGNLGLVPGLVKSSW